MHAYSPQDLPHSVAPGYYLAQGRLAGMLPMVGLTLANSAGSDSWAARRRYADNTMAARHGRAAERYAELLGCSRGVVMKACQLLSLARLPTAGTPEHQAVYQSVLARREDDTPSMPPAWPPTWPRTSSGFRCTRSSPTSTRTRSRRHRSGRCTPRGSMTAGPWQ